MAELRKSQAGIFTRCLMLALVIWSWMAAAPRATLRLAAYLLDAFESTTLAIFSKYQGDNILKFLYKHRHVTHNATEAGCVHESKDQAVQTDGHTSEARNHAERRAVVLDKLIEDLLPELLKALHEIPPRKAIEQLVAQQSTQMHNLSEQHQDMLLLLQRMYSVSTTSDTENQSALQALSVKVEAIDMGLNRILDMLEEVSKTTHHRNEQLTTVADGIDMIGSKHEASAAMVLQLSKCVNRMDTTLTEINTRPRSTPKHFADAATETSEPFYDKAHQSHVSDSHPETVASLHISASSPDAALPGNGHRLTSPIDPPSPGIPANSETDSVESEATVERMHAMTALKEIEPNAAPTSETMPEVDTSTAANSKSRRFSIRKSLKRHSWLGKKPL
ncbi:hypothetical protein H4R24_002500 [Coemansia sp. RSA 988]|nr:hypothetical protein H4R24_002500 [Coemansia sp. RSA 988]